MSTGTNYRFTWASCFWALACLLVLLGEGVKYERDLRMRATMMIHTSAIKARLEWIEIQQNSPPT